MNLPFPHIEHLDQVREAIKDRDEFIVAERDWGYVVNYLVNLIDSFPQPNTKNATINEHYMIRRECRGIKFDLSGKLIARPFHKFFNLGEKPEVEAHNIDFNQPFIILEKLDGSMVHPVALDKQVVYMTKMGLSDVVGPAQKFADEKGHQAIFYNDFSWDLMKSDMTPIFEWCSRKQRIVVDYPEDQLILTAVRRMKSGEYLTYDQMDELARAYRVPVVGRWNGTWEGVNEFCKEIQHREDEEGYIFRFKTGHMLKNKNIWYLQLHKTKELLTHEKDVWALVLDNKHDDAKAFMDQEAKDRIDAFATDLYKKLDDTVERLKWVVIEAQDNLNNSKKRFAVEYINDPDANIANNEKSLLFKIWDGHDPRDVVYDYVRNQLGTGTKLDGVRNLAGGIKWNDYFDTTTEEE